ncbi:glycosyltransferase family 4 protein [Anditalea andensis]|uniref:glycosyltransferase family 4 protein n=1 Tax=Anditalea andensis TaxID=1048983 RepID=UPI0005568103|nr:glycosyltransferase family 4 protein [Anditalea andensis]
MQRLKKVLIVTYYWPPSAGSGVQRWLKFAKYLNLYGWEPVIFTPENPDFELQDPGLLKELPADLEVLKFPIWEPYALFRKLKKEKINDTAKILEKEKKKPLDRLAIWLRANLLVPDPRVFWVKPSVEYLRQINEANKFEAIITTGPPHSMHLIGLELKRKTGIKWLADFRDPWSTWEFLDVLPMHRFVRNQHLKMEASVLKEADAVVTISPTFQKEIEIIADREIKLITNGFDSTDLPSDFPAYSFVNDAFNIVYTGIIDSIRNPLPFLLAFRATFEKLPIKVNLIFVGKVSDTVVDHIRYDAWLKNHVTLAGYVSHQEVFNYYAKANLLLLILTNTKNAKGNIPGKLFEYIATGRPIIALGDPEGDTAKIINEAEAGHVFSHTDHKGMEDFLLDSLQYIPAIKENGNVNPFERKYLTQKLAKLLDDL